MNKRNVCLTAVSAPVLNNSIKTGSRVVWYLKFAWSQRFVLTELASVWSDGRQGSTELRRTVDALRFSGGASSFAVYLTPLPPCTERGQTKETQWGFMMGPSMTNERTSLISILNEITANCLWINTILKVTVNYNKQTLYYLGMLLLFHLMPQAFSVADWRLPAVIWTCCVVNISALLAVWTCTLSVLGQDKFPDELVRCLGVEGQGIVQRLQVRTLLQEGLLQPHAASVEVLLWRNTGDVIMSICRNKHCQPVSREESNGLEPDSGQCYSHSLKIEGLVLLLTFSDLVYLLS